VQVRLESSGRAVPIILHTLWRLSKIVWVRAVCTELDPDAVTTINDPRESANAGGRFPHGPAQETR